MKLKKDDLNDQLMVTAAHRYCLGRQSYIVGACLQWLIDTWDQFEPNTQQVIVRDTAEALMDGHAGSPTCDVPLWKDFLRWSQSRVSDIGLNWAIDNLRYKQKPWPVDLPQATDPTPSSPSMEQSSLELSNSERAGL